MKIAHTDKEPLFFDSYDANALQNIINTQHKVIDYMKKQKGIVKLYSILVVVDDFADGPTFSRQNKMLPASYTRGRHKSTSTITATQKFSSIAPTIRVNATELYVYRLKNYKDLETLINEVSAVADKKTLLHIYICIYIYIYIYI